MRSRRTYGTVLLLSILCLTLTGCIDLAVGGIRDGISEGIEDVIQDIVSELIESAIGVEP